MSHCAYLNTLPLYTARIRQRMAMGGNFSASQNPVRCFSRTSSQPSISTGTEPELRIAVGSTWCIVEGRYHVTAWNRFYPLFFTPIKNNKKWQRRKNFSASPLIKHGVGPHRRSYVGRTWGLNLEQRPVEIRWHTRSNQISSFGETDESI